MKKKIGRLLNVDQAAERLNVSKSSIYRLLSEGQLYALRVRGSTRLPEDGIDDYIDRQILKYQLDEGMEI